MVALASEKHRRVPRVEVRSVQGDREGLPVHRRVGVGGDVVDGRAHSLNGLVTAELDDDRACEEIIALQLHAGPTMKVEFRSIKLKKL